MTIQVVMFQSLMKININDKIILFVKPLHNEALEHSLTKMNGNCKSKGWFALVTKLLEA